MIKNYKYRDREPEPWEFSTMECDRVNLLVGETGSGKSRFLNTIFNLGMNVGNGKPISNVDWKLSVEIEANSYDWEISFDNENSIVEETLSIGAIGAEEQKVLVSRNKDSFIFQGRDLPKLDFTKSAVSLLKDEDEITPLNRQLRQILRRSFQSSGLSPTTQLQNIDDTILKKMKSDHSMANIWSHNQTVSVSLYLLKKYHAATFKEIIARFQEVFPFAVECDVRQMDQKTSPVGGIVPIFSIKERGVKGWIGLHEMSSGMQKVLLLITDIIMLPKGSIYLIDEYENSLGINAINFLPDFLDEFRQDLQFFIATHHPYIINNMPINQWHVFKRTGSKVQILSGESLAERYGHSKQKSFIQLINDPDYTSG